MKWLVLCTVLNACISCWAMWGWLCCAGPCVFCVVVLFRSVMCACVSILQCMNGLCTGVARRSYLLWALHSSVKVCRVQAHCWHCMCVFFDAAASKQQEGLRSAMSHAVLTGWPGSGTAFAALERLYALPAPTCGIGIERVRTKRCVLGSALEVQSPNSGGVTARQSCVIVHRLTFTMACMLCGEKVWWRAQDIEKTSWRPAHAQQCSGRTHAFSAHASASASSHAHTCFLLIAPRIRNPTCCTL
jgi:hypothetical protein